MEQLGLTEDTENATDALRPRDHIAATASQRPPMLLVQARPRMVRIVMFGNALTSHLRLQLEPPTPLSHWFVNMNKEHF